jgi:hypothetical protein
VRVVDRRAEPTRRNLDAEPLVDFHLAAGGIDAVMGGKTTTIEEAAADLFDALLGRLDGRTTPSVRPNQQRLRP